MRKAVERAMRSLAGLPVDDWQPEHWDTFEAARAVLVDELGRVDRAAASRRRRASEPQALTKARTVVYGRSGGRCEANTPDCPPGPHNADHVHHMRGREYHEARYLLHVCHEAHAYIHAHPAESYEQGWMLKRNGVAS